jgi:hypothetical protein
MRLETWISMGSIGLSAMFVAILLSFYNFLINQGENPSNIIDPASLLVQEVSISAAPAIILAGVVFAMLRTTGNKPAGLLLIASGIIMAAGMAVAAGMLPHIPRQYLISGVSAVPYIFLAAGSGVVGIGAYLTIMSKRSRSAGSLDDLR